MCGTGSCPALDTVTTAHQLANVGQADMSDVLQAEVEAEQAQVDFWTAQRTYLQMFRALTALAGRPELPLSSLEGDLENPPQVDANRIIDQIVRDSPSVKRAEQEFGQAKRSSRAPDARVCRISASCRLTAEFRTDQRISSNPGGGLQGFATAGVTLPLFNRNQSYLSSQLE